MPGIPAISIRGLRKRYGDGTQALDGIDLDVPQGSCVCLAGPNGAGKSTMLQCIAGLCSFEGEILLAGSPAGGRGRPVDPSILGIVFQNPDDQLFCTSVREDVAFGPRNLRMGQDEVESRVAGALRAVGLEAAGGRAPHHLSGGERKRAAIAAVIACGPSMLVLDEPWGGLDARSSRSVAAILRGFTGSRLIATQDPRQAAPICDRLVIIDEGRIAADGPMEVLSAEEELLERHGLLWHPLHPDQDLF
jgi:cobalt/nickel transport system ATP-binding protein